MAKIKFYDVDNVTSSSDNPQRSSVGFFSLKNDGDEAIVRIMHDDVESFDIHTCHVVQIDGRFRNVECIREPMSPVSDCPMCASKEKITTKLFIKMIQYVRDEQTGQIKANPVIWDRGISYAKILKNLLDEYGPLSENIFKIKRSGAAKSMDTTYSIMLGSPMVYKKEMYPIIPNAFDNYSVLNNIVVLNKNYDEMCQLCGMTSKASAANTSTTPSTDTNNYSTTSAAHDDSIIEERVPTRSFNTEAPARPRRY